MKKMILGFVGGGNMAEALIRGLLIAKTLSAKNMCVLDRNPERLLRLKKKYKVPTTEDPQTLAVQTQALLLAVKPQQMPVALSSLAPYVKSRHLILSIMAGVPIRAIQKYLKKTKKIIRTMPNTPALIGRGMTALYPALGATSSQIRLALKLFRAVGEVLLVKKEGDLDAVTALSGSGPAYLFHLAEGMIAGGLKAGLTREASYRLTLQTLYGASSLLIQSGESPETLRQKVTSKKGTTEAAMKVMQRRAFKKTTVEAIVVATRRSQKLKKEFL